MPIVHVQLLAGRSAEQKTRLLAELTNAVHRCLGVDPDRVHVQITEFPEGSWARGGVALPAVGEGAR